MYSHGSLTSTPSIIMHRINGHILQVKGQTSKKNERTSTKATRASHISNTYACVPTAGTCVCTASCPKTDWALQPVALRRRPLPALPYITPRYHAARKLLQNFINYPYNRLKPFNNDGSSFGLYFSLY